MVEITKGIYRHSKSGQFYEVLGEVRHSETMESMVLYSALYDDSSKKISKGDKFVRPKEIFLDNVEINGVTVPRFKFEENMI